VGSIPTPASPAKCKSQKGGGETLVRSEDPSDSLWREQKKKEIAGMQMTSFSLARKRKKPSTHFAAGFPNSRLNRV